MALIETMPTLFGEQYYPDGFPLPSNKISVNDKSILQMFFDNCEGDLDKETEETKLIHDFMLYWLLAPCFKISDEDKEIAPSLSNDELFDLLLDNGLDPF